MNKCLPQFCIVLLAICHWRAECVPFVTKRVSLHNPISIDFSGWIPLRQQPEDTAGRRPLVGVDPSTDPMHASASATSDQLIQHQTDKEQQEQEQEEELRSSSALDPSAHLRDQMAEGKTAPLSDHFLTVPVAVETDAEHVLSETDLNQIAESVITNWNQKPLKSDSFPHLTPFVTKLMPKPEIELKQSGSGSRFSPTERDGTGGGGEDDRTIYLASASATDQDRGGRPEATVDTESEYTFVKMDKNSLNPNSNSSAEENLFHAYFAPRDHVPAEGYVRLTKSEFKSLFKNAEILFV